MDCMGGTKKTPHKSRWKRGFAPAGLLAAVALSATGCQQLSLKTLIASVILPASPTAPWVTSVGDRSVTLSWNEPTDSDVGAVQIVYQEKHAASSTPSQVVVAAGKDGATVALPNNNTAYLLTINMVDKAGHISGKGAIVNDQFTAQLPIKTVSHFTGLGVGSFSGSDAYTYDSTSGMPATVVTYDALGNPVSKHDMQYGPGSVNKVLDLHSSYVGTAWVLGSYENTYFDSTGKVTKKEYYGGPPMQLLSTDTYSWDSTNDLTGWVSTNATGTKTGQTNYFVLPVQEQWAICDASGVLKEMGQNDYDASGRIQTVTYFDISMTVISQKRTNTTPTGTS
jgi:hypothetical protein